MPAAPLPINENERLETLYAAALLDTGPETFFEEAVDAVRRRTRAPIALVSLVDRYRQWFKASRGIEASETDRACAFCGYAILDDAPLIVDDAREDERFRDNPLVTGDPWLVAYAGAPIVLKPGVRIGTLCAIDKTPRCWTGAEILQLREVAQLLAQYIELRRALLATNPQRYLDLAVSGEYRL